jgi:OOP family OmpA-OmpF porin
MGKFKILLPLFLGITFSAFAQLGEQIPNAQPGKCYAKCLIPDEFKVTTEQVVVKPAGVKTIVKPAVYETKSEQVEVKAAGKRLIPVPAK